MCTRVIGSGLRLLVAALLCWLLTLPAAAHFGHGRDMSALIKIATFDVLVDRASSRDASQGARVIAAPAPALVSSCCCGQSGCCVGSGLGSGMACGPGSCGHGSGALDWSHPVRIEPSAMGAGICLFDQLLAGVAPGPDDRPPRL